jgi:hypothetical protein
LPVVQRRRGGVGGATDAEGRERSLAVAKQGSHRANAKVCPNRFRSAQQDGRGCLRHCRLRRRPRPGRGLHTIQPVRGAVIPPSARSWQHEACGLRAGQSPALGCQRLRDRCVDGKSRIAEPIYQCVLEFLVLGATAIRALLSMNRYMVSSLRFGLLQPFPVTDRVPGGSSQPKRLVESFPPERVLYSAPLPT